VGPFADEVDASAGRSGDPTVNGDCALNQEFSVQELRDAVAGLGTSTAATKDRILPCMIKRAMPHIEQCMLSCVNALFQAGEFPDDWACGWISPLFKKGDRLQPANYRGITVCSHVSKVYTSMLNGRFVKWLDEGERISPLQAGFRKGRDAQ
jgi:hypothetical protein